MPFLGFIGRALHWIGELFKKVEEKAKDVLPDAIAVVNAIKNIDASVPFVLDFALGKLGWPAEKIAKARAAVQKVVPLLSDSQECLALPLDEQLGCVVAKIKARDPNAKILAWSNMAVLIAHDLADGNLAIQELLGIIQYVYEHPDGEPPQKQWN